MVSDEYDAPTLSTQISGPSNQNKRWIPFADNVKPELLKSSTIANSASSSSFFPPSQSMSSDSVVSSNPKGTQEKPIHSVSSYSSLTDAVKNYMNKGQLTTVSHQPQRRTSSGSTLSTKELNHLLPQSM